MRCRAVENSLSPSKARFPALDRSKIACWSTTPTLNVSAADPNEQGHMIVTAIAATMILTCLLIPLSFPEQNDIRCSTVHRSLHHRSSLPRLRGVFVFIELVNDFGGDIERRIAIHRRTAFSLLHDDQQPQLPCDFRHDPFGFFSEPFENFFL